MNRKTEEKGKKKKVGEERTLKREREKERKNTRRVGKKKE